MGEKGQSIMVTSIAAEEAPTSEMTDGPALGTGAELPSNKATSTAKGPEAPKHPPPKTDKPRPHVCITCTRSFARLEHLKRHERSHTKEKPFECPECTRCFARRDLLLRHQQKLHSSTTPASRPRGSRRESVAGVANGRVRKNSTTSGPATMRPRANTLSHVDSATLGMLANSIGANGRQVMPNHHHHSSMSMIGGSQGSHYRAASINHHSFDLPKLETGLPIDLSSGLRTAPPFGGFGAEFDLGSLDVPTDHGDTINPHALHVSGGGLDGSNMHFHQLFGGMSASQALTDDDAAFDWMAQGFENQMTFAQANENAIDDSSPSAMSTNSPNGLNELSGDPTIGAMQQTVGSVAPMWTGSLANQAAMVNSPVSMELMASFHEMVQPSIGTISPKSLFGRGGSMDLSLPTPPDMASIDSSGLHFPGLQLPFSKDGPESTASTASMDSSLRQSSVTTTSYDLVTDHIRSVLLAGLCQTTGFGQRKYSQPAVSSPLSPSASSRPRSFNANTFPSTSDLQRYVTSYIRFFHPHLPFLHIPTLNFESSDYTTPVRLVSGQSPYGHPTVTGGGSCLILSIAAIGALYEHELSQSKDLFECAKRLISSYLEERRKANMTKTQFAPKHATEREDTPLWLVQAMLLNVIYGHNCGDKTAAELASNHCAALVSLARGAELARPTSGYSTQGSRMDIDDASKNSWGSLANEVDESNWIEWKVAEERKRTLYSVFILSSMLVTAYNHPPALTNSEIRLNLPCDEQLWAAESAQTWKSYGGTIGADANPTTFADSLTHLLMAAQRERRQSTALAAFGTTNEPELRPSTFGCLILVNALHNYIWETRQRHLGRQWTTSETEQMHAHIEPALRAWQAAWASNPTHSLERPNPFGAGPLSADCIPLLDLAYVRLFINLGRSKEAFWQRDYDAMAEELAKGLESVHNRGGPNGINENPPPTRSYNPKIQPQMKTPPQDTSRQEGEVERDQELHQALSSRREKHLRKAAFYAADSLSVSDKLGLSFAEYTSRELPVQSAMCAFDCAQVLAEWITTVQERVGKYIGVIGRDEMNLMEVPGILLLEDEDRKLIQKIDEVLSSAEQKIEARGSFDLRMAQEGGHGSRILVLTAYLLERDAVWPVFKLMARSLEIQANHIRERALASVSGS